MDPHHHQYSQQQQQQEENGSSTNNGSSSCVGGVGSGSKVGFLCRQSSTRWIPTSDQIRILRDLYYNNGIRSPSNEQIQRISARLRQYGKIEGKNVFYWFQNHKARERQKKRLTVDVPNSNAAAASANYCTGNNTKCNNSSTNTPVMSPAGVTTPCSSSGYYGVGQIGSSGYSDPVFTERKFRDYYCMPGAGDVPAGNESSAGLLGFEAACETTPWMVHHYTSEHEAIPATREIETLPLFPVNAAAGGDGYKLPTPSKDGYSSMNCYLQMPFYSCSGQQQQPEELYNVHCNGSSAGAVAASLELSLNSYYYAPPGST